MFQIPLLALTVPLLVALNLVIGYRKWLVPIAALGVIVTLIRPIFGVVAYMRILPWWAFAVSVIWSFSFLKHWERRNGKKRRLLPPFS